MTDRNSDTTFHMDLELQADTATVWPALSSAQELARWFPPQAEMDPVPGGHMRWAWPGMHEWNQTIEVIEPEKRLRTRYASGVDAEDGSGKVPLFLDFTLTGKGGTTTLRVVHSGFGAHADFDAEFDGISRGWPVELHSLKLYVEHHAGHDRQLAWRMAPLDLPAEDAWSRLMGPDGFVSSKPLDRLAVGEAFRIETADGTVFEGKALQCREREFSGIARSHGNAFLRLGVEDCNGLYAWLWLASYAQPEALTTKTLATFDRILAATALGTPEASTETVV